MKEAVTKYKEDLPDSVGNLLDILGYEGLCELSELYGGSQMYVPKIPYMFRSCLQQLLIDEYDGTNQRELCTKYNFCTRTVQRLVAKEARR